MCARRFARGARRRKCTPKLPDTTLLQTQPALTELCSSRQAQTHMHMHQRAPIIAASANATGKRAPGFG
ncbi:hypothetical protein C2E23DRAFT_838814 [Lenzites betulinus]|nr:hypothetical protein C2E23DRAFT_838814 [Lenzites betulinus]